MIFSSKNLARLWHERSGRDQAIIRSVLTAIGAKGCGMLLQIAALPYAIRILGLDKFGAYATAAAMFSWMSLLEVGIGANMVRGMVSGISRNDTGVVGSIFLTSATVVVGLALLVTLSGLALFQVLAASSGNSVWRDSQTLFSCAAVLAGLQVSTWVPQRVRAAYQETHINNLFGAAANLCSAALLWIMLKPGASSTALLLSLNGPPVFFQMLNGVWLWATKPALRDYGRLEWHNVAATLGGGGWLALAAAGVYFEREAPKLILASTAGVAEVGRYACAVQLLLILAGLILMISNPMLPAIAEAIETGDHLWWRRRMRILYAMVLVLGSVAAILMAFQGPTILAGLFGRGVRFTSVEAIGLTVWTTVILLSNMTYTVLVAGGRMRVIAFWQLAQGAVILVGFKLLYGSIGLGGMFWVSSALTLILTFTPWLLTSHRLGRPSASAL